MFVAPIAGRLTDKIGPRPLIVTGLAVVAISLFMQSNIDLSSGYDDLLIPFILMGFGIALTMSPMSTAAMNAVDQTKAGLASGLLSMSRMVGGTFGVAALGAIFQAHGRSDLSAALTPIGVSDSTIDSLTEQLGSGGLADSIAQLPPDQAQQAGAAAKEAFINALAGSVGISAAVAAAGAVGAIFLIQGKKPGAPGPAGTGDEKPDVPEPQQPAAPELVGSGS